MPLHEFKDGGTQGLNTLPATKQSHLLMHLGRTIRMVILSQFTIAMKDSAFTLGIVGNGLGLRGCQYRDF